MQIDPHNIRTVEEKDRPGTVSLKASVQNIGKEVAFGVKASRTGPLEIEITPT